MTAKDPAVPVYIITGFLDGGKTNFLRYTMEADYFNDGEKTVLLLTEDGEEEYDDVFLRNTHTEKIDIDAESEITESFFEKLNKEKKPDRILLEWNGMWSVKNLLAMKLPKHWLLYQIITVFDGGTFPLYLNNMKNQTMELLMNTDMVIYNRCEEDTDLVTLKRTVRSVNQKCELIFENKNGEEVECPEPDLPYDVTGKDIEITDENYGTFYIDLSSHPERYIDHRIHFLVQIMKNKNFPPNMFIGGRRAMTCCEADIRFLPYIFLYEKAHSLKASEFAKVSALLKWEFHEGYQEEGPVFYVEELNLSNKPAEELITF